jgi:type IV pilus assembly protein PilB
VVANRADFCDSLVKSRIVSAEQVAEAKQLAKRKHIEDYEALVELQYATGEEVMRALATQHGLKYVNPKSIRISENVIAQLSEAVARENVVLPFAETDDTLTVLASKPNDLDTQDKLRFILNRRVEIALAPKEAILEAINQYYGQSEGESADSMIQEFTDTQIDFTRTTEDAASAGMEDAEQDSAPIVRLVSQLIREAVMLRASDIHIEPFEDRIRIRYRIDGVLVEHDKTPIRLLGAVLSRIKILSKLDIAERRRPQDGRIKITIGEKELDLRVSIIPTNHGQSVVMRILDKDNIKIGVRQLGFGERDFAKFNQLIKRPNGIVLVTGPTGSGKTTTLYAALNALNRPDRKIITAEDPVEYYLPGVNQVEVRHSIGLDFARIIRAMLRQAPNIILVGEMRDTETASMGIQASLTGHLVFSTLHTNDAPSAVTRMVDMGVPNYLVASSVIAILAQRLVRVVCSKCKTKFDPLASVLADAGIPPELAKKASFAKGKGCTNCNKTGMRGRLGIYELMIVTSKVRELIFQNVSSTEIRVLAINQGMSTLYQDGMQKVMKGITSFEEVYRNAKRTEQDVIDKIY